jgi:NAD(P)-dependent dehydrogenase (short-subunit alcohol dehydrogenase family)
MDRPPVVLITGALTGIGRATAVTFARAGAVVVVSGCHDDAGQALAAELRELGAAAEFIRADVRSDDHLAALAGETVARFGRLDVAVNSAGTDGEFSPVAELTASKYAGTFDTNVLGTLLSMKHELRIMQKKDRGASSTSARSTARRASRTPRCTWRASTPSSASRGRPRWRPPPTASA